MRNLGIKKILGILAIITILVALPIIIFQTQKSQDIRQRAAGVPPGTGDTKIYLSPDTGYQIPKNTTFDVELKIDTNNNSVANFTIELIYDSSRFSYNSIQEGADFDSVIANPNISASHVRILAEADPTNPINADNVIAATISFTANDVLGDGIIAFAESPLNVVGKSTTGDIISLTVETSDVTYTVIDSASPLTPPCESYGDVDLDDVVTQSDADAALEIAAGLGNYTDQQRLNADVDGVNGPNSRDALMIERYIAGLITTFEVCPPIIEASNLNTTNQSCTNDQVNITFNWTHQPNSTSFIMEQQWLDLSITQTNPFNAGNFINHDVLNLSIYATTTAPDNIGPLVPETTHFWRINTYNSIDNTWYTSTTAQFDTISCNSPTNTPIPTLSPGDTSLAMSVRMPGIGLSSGAIENNPTPTRPERFAEVVVLDENNNVVYSSTLGGTPRSDLTTTASDEFLMVYAGIENLGTNFSSGSYTVKVRFDNTLFKKIPGIVQIVSGTQIQIPTVTLVSGDLNQNNIMDLQDYNDFLSCFRGDPSCDGNLFTLADLNDNGNIDILDLNILQRGFTIREGD